MAEEQVGEQKQASICFQTCWYAKTCGFNYLCIRKIARQIHNKTVYEMIMNKCPVSMRFCSENVSMNLELDNNIGLPKCK